MSRTIEYKGKFFIEYFVDPPVALITSKIWLGILSTSFWRWSEGIFPHASKIALSTSFINFCNNQSPQIFYWIEVWRVHWVVKKTFFCSSKLFFVINALWIAALSYWKIHSFPHRRHPYCTRDKSFSIFT